MYCKCFCTPFSEFHVVLQLWLCQFLNAFPIIYIILQSGDCLWFCAHPKFAEYIPACWTGSRYIPAQFGFLVSYCRVKRVNFLKIPARNSPRFVCDFFEIWRDVVSLFCFIFGYKYVVFYTSLVICTVAIGVYLMFFYFCSVRRNVSTSLLISPLWYKYAKECVLRHVYNCCKYRW